MTPARILERLSFLAPKRRFHDPLYLRINQRRLEHLASLGLPIPGRTVLEVGAGIGDLTSFFLDRGCRGYVTEPRAGSLRIIRNRFPSVEVSRLDLDNPDLEFRRTFAIVFVYGVLYHLSKPSEAIRYLSERCEEMLLLETCVSFGEHLAVNPLTEDRRNPTEAIVGGCRPTRPWVMAELRRHFDFVYVPNTQPWHEEFPLDWTSVAPSGGNVRSIFVASRRSLNNSRLTTELLTKQVRNGD